MTDKIGDKVKFNTLEKATSADLNATESLGQELLFEVMGELLGLGGAVTPSALTPVPAQPFRVLRGLRVVEGSGGMDVTVKAGMGFAWWVGGGLSSLSRTRPIILSADVSIPIDAADPADDRYDRILVSPALYDAESQVRDIRDGSTGGYIPSAVSKRLRREVRSGTELRVLKGTPGAGAPLPIPANEYSIATVLVPAAAAGIVAADIVDERVAATVPTRPRWSGIVKGTLGAGFNAAALADKLKSEAAEGGITFDSVSRTGAGEYTIYLAGSSADGDIPLVHITPYSGNVLVKVPSPTVGGLLPGVVQVFVELRDLGGLLADADFAVQVELPSPRSSGLY